MDREFLRNQAKSILRANWRDGFTIPTGKLYPFQWNWDSGFVSIGLGHYTIEKAILEIGTLFSGQWANGMVPHILFHSEKEKSYFPNYDFWESQVNPGAPDKPKSSGITQPPVHGFVLENLLQLHPDNERLHRFIKKYFSKILAYHRFLYQYRDPEREGLIFIYHPWESGRDNSPIWDESLDRIEIDYNQLPPYQRRDTSVANASERPTSYQYDRYVYLLQLGKKYRYDGPEIYQESPFLVQDNMMNAILIKSNESLIRLGKRFGLNTKEVEEWQQQSKRVFDQKLWEESLGTYTSYDLRGNKRMKYKEIGGIVSLFASIPNKEKAKRINDYLMSLHDRGYYLCPSFDPDSSLFDSKRYWRGPIWPQMNWMIYKGLLNYDYHETASIVRGDILELVSKLGFYEYFESRKSDIETISKGYGGGNFSWTASTIFDLISVK